MPVPEAHRAITAGEGDAAADATDCANGSAGKARSMSSALEILAVAERVQVGVRPEDFVGLEAAGDRALQREHRPIAVPAAFLELAGSDSRWQAGCED